MARVRARWLGIGFLESIDTEYPARTQMGRRSAHTALSAHPERSTSSYKQRLHCEQKSAEEKKPGALDTTVTERHDASDSRCSFVPFVLCSV